MRERKGQRPKAHMTHLDTKSLLIYKESQPPTIRYCTVEPTHISQSRGWPNAQLFLGSTDHYRGRGRSSHPTMIHNHCSWYHRREWVGRGMGMGDCGLRGSCGGGETSRARPENTGPPLFGDRRNRGPIFFFFFVGSFVENREQKGASTRPAHQVTRPTYSAVLSSSYALAPGQGLWFVCRCCSCLFVLIYSSPLNAILQQVMNHHCLSLTVVMHRFSFCQSQQCMHGSPF